VGVCVSNWQNQFRALTQGAAPYTCREDKDWRVWRWVHLLGSWGVVKLHQGLEAGLLLEGGDLVHKAKGAEHQVQHIKGDGHVRLQGKRELRNGGLRGICLGKGGGVPFLLLGHIRMGWGGLGVGGGHPFLCWDKIRMTVSRKHARVTHRQ